MKKCILILLVVASGFGAKAQFEGTKWKTTLQLESPTDVVFAFGKDTVEALLADNNMPLETMLYTVKDSVITLQKVTGQSDCDGNVVGKYKFEMKGDEVQVTLVSDDCYNRSNVLSNVSMSKMK